MEVTFKPKACKGDAAEYEGEVVMKMPKYDERMELIDTCQIEISEGDDETKVADRVRKQGPTALIRRVASKLPPFVVSVNIKRKADGFVFDSLEKMEYDSDMAGVITEMAMKLIGKHQVGNVLPPS